MFNSAFALALLLIWAFIRWRLAVSAQETVRSLELEGERQTTSVLPPPSEVEREAA